jgi:hypothetical protein
VESIPQWDLDDLLAWPMSLSSEDAWDTKVLDILRPFGGITVRQHLLRGKNHSQIYPVPLVGLFFAEYRMELINWNRAVESF